MEDKDRAASPSRPATEFAGNSSSWPLGPDDSDGVYFFSGDRDSGSILGDFGWNLDPAAQPHRIGAADDASDLAGADGGGRGFWFPAAAHSAPTEQVDKATMSSASASNNQSVSSSSSEDPPEKSAVSGEKPPPEIP